MVLPVGSGAADAGVIWENPEGQLFSLFATFSLCGLWQTAFSGEAWRVLFEPKHALDSEWARSTGQF